MSEGLFDDFLVSLLLGIVHADLLPAEGAIPLHMYAHQVVAWFRVVVLTHRVERQVVHTTDLLLIPLVDVSAEDDVSLPLHELVQQEEALLARKGRGKL